MAATPQSPTRAPWRRAAARPLPEEFLVDSNFLVQGRYFVAPADANHALVRSVPIAIAGPPQSSSAGLTQGAHLSHRNKSRAACTTPSPG